MVKHLVLLFMFIFLLWDISLLRRYNPRLYIKVFDVSVLFSMIMLSAIAVLILRVHAWVNIVPPFILIFVLPVYLLRRSQYLLCIREEAGAQNFLLDTHVALNRSGKFLMLTDATGVVIKWVFAMVLLAHGLQLTFRFLPELNEELSGLLISAVFSSALIMFLIYQVIRRQSNQEFLLNVGWCSGKWSFIKTFLVSSLIGLLFAYISATIILGRKVQPNTPLTDALSSVESPLYMVGFLFMAIFVAPFVEEIVFRGYFFNVIHRLKGQRFAVCFIALTFGGLHYGQYWGDWAAIVMVTILGFALTIFRAWTGTTVASTIMHYFYNTGVTIIPVIIMMISNPAYFEYQAYYKTNDAATNERLLLESIKRDPELAEAYHELARLYVREGNNWQRALELTKQALALDPDNDDYLKTKRSIEEKLRG